MGWRTVVVLKIGVISDVHSNLAAFEAVLNGLSKARAEVIWSLGDLVGYAAQVNESIQLLKSLKMPYVHIAGNHDLGAVGLISRQDFNSDGQAALNYTEKVLTRENHRFLSSLPKTFQPRPEVLLVHGCPRDPIWEYLLTIEQAESCFHYFNQSICFFGHTHLPVIYSLSLASKQVKKVIPQTGTSYSLNLAEERYLINPGSVGQPRDGNPEASYCLFDLKSLTVTWQRASYDIKRTQAAIKQAGLPLMLATRLSFGL